MVCRDETIATHPDARRFFTKARSSFLRKAYPLSEESTVSEVADFGIIARLTPSRRSGGLYQGLGVLRGGRSLLLALKLIYRDTEEELE